MFLFDRGTLFFMHFFFYFNNLVPIFPPGCNFPNSLIEKFFFFEIDKNKASPKANIIVVEVEGANLFSPASSRFGKIILNEELSVFTIFCYK